MSEGEPAAIEDGFQSEGEPASLEDVGVVFAASVSATLDSCAERGAYRRRKHDADILERCGLAFGLDAVLD